MNYKTLFHFTAQHKLVLPRPHPWSLVAPDERRLGAVEGLPGLRGIITATNGILAAIENEVGIVHIVHRDWFVPERDEHAPQSSNFGRSKREAALAEKYV